MAIFLPRIARSSDWCILSRSRPSNRTSPVIRPPLARPMMARLVTLLPEPDSPTIPRVWPGSSEKLTPSTALTTPSSVSKWTLRSLTSSSAMPTSPPRPGYREQQHHSAACARARMVLRPPANRSVASGGEVAVGGVGEGAGGAGPAPLRAGAVPGQHVPDLLGRAGGGRGLRVGRLGGAGDGQVGSEAGVRRPLGQGRLLLGGPLGGPLGHVAAHRHAGQRG